MKDNELPLIDKLQSIGNMKIANMPRKSVYLLLANTFNHCDFENRDQSLVQPTCPVPAPMQGPNSHSDLKDRGTGMDFYHLKKVTLWWMESSKKPGSDGSDACGDRRFIIRAGTR